MNGLEGFGSRNRLCTYPIGRDDPSIDTVRCLPVPGYRKTAAGPSAFKLIVDPLLTLTAVRQIRRFKPDVLHCHLHEGVLVGWLAKYLALRPRLKIGFDVQGGLSSELASYGHLKLSFTRRLIRWIEAFVIARANAFFCSSEASVRLFTTEFGVADDAIHHVPDGADVVVDTDRSTQAASVPVALYAGGLTESKGIGMLQKAIKLAADRGLNLHFRIIGYPTEPLQAFVDEHEFDNCELLGQVPFDQLAEHMADASVALEPKSGATSEASGKLLNYMAASLPVVCFDTANNRGMLGDGGYFASSPTPEAFVEQLQAVIGSPEEARARGAQGHDRVHAKFSWHASGETILTTYARLLADT